MKKIFLFLVASLFALMSNAQIGYQVALLNTATGEPRSNETVSCLITLTNSKGEVVYTGTQSATSNDFGVVSLTVGDANTFSKMDWSKLPLYISVSVDGILVGQTEVLTVPVAEHAKHYGTLTYENIGEKKVVGKSNVNTVFTDEYSWFFNGRTVKQLEVYKSKYGEYEETVMIGEVRIDGNSVFGYLDEFTDKGTFRRPFVGHYSPEDDTIYITRE